MDRIGAKPNAVYRDAVSKCADVTQRQVKHLSDKKRATDPYDDLVSLVRAYDDVLPYVCLKSLNVTNPCLLIASKETIELLKSKHGATIFIDGTHAMSEHVSSLPSPLLLMVMVSVLPMLLHDRKHMIHMLRCFDN